MPFTAVIHEEWKLHSILLGWSRCFSDMACRTSTPTSLKGSATGSKRRHSGGGETPPHKRHQPKQHVASPGPAARATISSPSTRRRSASTAMATRPATLQVPKRATTQSAEVAALTRQVEHMGNVINALVDALGLADKVPEALNADAPLPSLGAGTPRPTSTAGPSIFVREQAASPTPQGKKILAMLDAGRTQAPQKTSSKGAAARVSAGKGSAASGSAQAAKMVALFINRSVSYSQMVLVRLATPRYADNKKYSARKSYYSC